MSTISLIKDKLFSTIGWSHFAVDLLNGQRSVLFVYLAVLFGLSNTQLGLFSTSYIVFAALLQPLFGYLADRGGFRWAIAGGTLWIGFFFTIGLFVQSTSSLIFFVIASFGSGAFHPAGTMQATLLGRSRLSSRETTSSSLFFLFGQLGLFVGPLLGGFLLRRSGSLGLLWLTSFAMLVGIIGFFRMREGLVHWEDQPRKQATESNRPSSRLAWIAFAILATSQSWVQQNIVIFLPKFLSDLGRTPEIYGTLTAIFIASGAMGMLSGGILADRFGKRRVAATMLGLAVLPLAAIPYFAQTPWLFLVIALAGYFAGSSHSIVVVLAQRYIPGGMAMSSGLILGFIFSSGAVGVLLSGYLADRFGLIIVFWLSAALALIASSMALSLEKN